jgi:hypothetical protein
MMKRHDIVHDTSDPELNQAVKSIWGKHKEALDYLLDNRPDPLSDVLREMDEQQGFVAQIGWRTC